MKNKRGFTLIEMLVTLALVAVVAALMYTFFGQGISLYSMESESAQEQANLRLVLSDITNRARLTDPSSITYADGVLTVDDTTYSFNSTDQEILRDGGTLATGISRFTVQLESGLLEVSITSTKGTVVSTSLSLVQ
jgi:prepilin-type N-terminal cleavage/methylation domain-containing protein